MGIREIRTTITEGLTSVLDKVQGLGSSQTNLENAAEIFTHAIQGQTYTPNSGVEGEFDTNSAEGRAYIDETRQQLLSAMRAYDKAHANREGASTAEDVLSSGYGIDVEGLIIDAQPVSAITKQTTEELEADGADHEEMRM